MSNRCKSNQMNSIVKIHIAFAFSFFAASKLLYYKYPIKKSKQTWSEILKQNVDHENGFYHDVLCLENDYETGHCKKNKIQRRDR